MISLKNIMSEVYTTPSYIIYCDMDGVLVDFERGFLELSKGIHPDSLPRDKFWSLFYSITKGKEKEYWANLPWMNDGKELWSFIKKFKPEILTAPPSNESKKGKLDWCKNNLGSVKVNFKQARDKHHFSKPNAILIDDKESTIENWNNSGGIGIYHTTANSTIQKLKDLGL